MKSVRKSTVQIRFEILEYLYRNPGPSLRTHIWRKATDLSYDDFLKHLTSLIEKRLVAETEGNCRLTEQGVSLYEKLRDDLPRLL